MSCCITVLFSDFFDNVDCLYLLKLKAVSQTERLISLERKMENISDRDEFEKQHKEMLMLKERQWNTEQRVSHLEETGHMTRSGGNGERFPI